jgi:hypothetical protein
MARAAMNMNYYALIKLIEYLANFDVAMVKGAMIFFQSCR